LHFLWYGDFPVGILMVVCRAMELDGNKKSAIGSNASKAKWIFLCIKIKEVLSKI
jgi:hypothetical protein